MSMNENLQPEALRQRLALVEGIARRAGELALSYFRNRDRLLIETKRSLSDLVSEADREVEVLIRQELSRAFPEDALIGEEHGVTDGQSGFSWAIDPIDGTAPYLNGLPGWCVSIGLMDDEENPVLGAIYAPVLGEMFLAARGSGATLNGSAIRVSDKRLEAGLLGLSSNDLIDPARIGRMHEDLAARGIPFVRYGSGALMLAYVAAGRLTGFFEARMSIWDCLAGYALILEAGGRIRPFAKGGARLGAHPVLAASVGEFDALEQLGAPDDPGWARKA